MTTSIWQVIRLMNQPSNEYWAERFAQLEALAHELGIEIYVEVQNDYQRAVKEIIRELAEWYSVILEDNISYAEVQKLLTNKQADDFRMDVDDYIKMASQAEIAESWQKTLEKAAARQRITRLDSIMIRLQQHIESLFGKQERLLYDGLQKLYEQEYYHTAFEIEKGFGVGHEFGDVNTDKLEAILKKPWAPDGANFSNRVWKHKENLVSTLRQELVSAVIRGDDFRTATKSLSDKMNVSQSAAGRLVMTESAFFASKSMADCMEEFDVEEYQFVATLDMRTSTICRDMDKKVFKMKDFAPGTTAPPLHCHCRSHISPYFADAAISERVARGHDGKTYMIPSNMNYRDWERVYVKKEISLEDWKKSLNKKENDVIIDIKDSQNYRKVERLGEAVEVHTPKHSFKVNRLADMPMEMYLSEKSNLKPKEAHTIHATLKEVAKMVNAPKGAELPRVYVVSPEEMRATASYLANSNNLFIVQGVFTKDFESTGYAGSGYLSTAVHEMLHWKDAQEYVLQKGKITDQGKYLRYRIEQDRKMLEKLDIGEEEAKNISKYAANSFAKGRFDEVYAEYRTDKLLKKV